MKKSFFIIAIIALLILGIFGAVKMSRHTKNNSRRIVAVTTLFPLYEFTKNIGKDKADVSLLIPPGVDPHSFEPKPSDIARINEAGLFVYTGKYMEPWAQDIINGLNKKNIAAVDAGAGIKLMKATGVMLSESRGGIDPHIWMDFTNARIMVNTIAGAFAEKDPANASFYRKNASEYNEKLNELDNEYMSTLDKCKSKVIVYGGHFALGYLAKRYGLQYFAAQGLAPDTEPTAKDLISLVDQIRKNDIKYVFYEELASPKIAETLSNETKTKMLLLNPMENLTKDDYKKNVTFISMMKRNLNNLSAGLSCSK